MIPENLPLLVGLVTGDQATAVEKVLKGNCPLDQALDALGRHWKIKVWFNQEHDFQVMRHTIKEGNTRYWKHCERSNVHVFCSIVLYQGTLLYKTTRNARHGFYFPSLDSIIKYEPVLGSIRTKEFRGLEHFASKFDRRFITESEILKLWNGKSAQHGGRYKPSDFHKIGPRGKQVMEDFLRLFVDVNTEGKCYFDRSELTQGYQTHHHTGRDIEISHTLGHQYVYYASEFQGCGNGRYGLVANKNEFLHLEDD